jgi:hypothetical protein
MSSGMRSWALTPPRTASCPHAAFQVEQNRNVAAMRWRGGLGSLLLRECPLTSCCPSSCSCRVGLHSAPLFLLCNLSLCSYRVGLLFIPSIRVVAEGLGVAVVVVARFLGGALSSFFLRLSKSSSWSLLGFEPNAGRLGPPPGRDFSRSVQTASGRRSRARRR